jgi:hypothetical protein
MSHHRPLETRGGRGGGRGKKLFLAAASSWPADEARQPKEHNGNRFFFPFVFFSFFYYYYDYRDYLLGLYVFISARPSTVISGALSFSLSLAESDAVAIILIFLVSRDGCVIIGPSAVNFLNFVGVGRENT